MSKQIIVELLENRCLLSASFETHINFQTAKSAVPTGYVPDTGAAYAARSDGLLYGWNTPLRAQTVARAAGKSPTAAQVLNHSFAVMNHRGRGSLWEIAVPNGTYTVTVTTGDTVASGLQQIEANGIMVVNGKSTAKKHWIVGTQSIVVTDGLLKLTDPRAGAAKMDAIDIVQQSTVGQTPGGGSSGTGGTTSQGTLNVKGTNVTITGNAAGGVRTIVDGTTNDYAAGQWTAVEYDGNLEDQSVNVLATVVPTTLTQVYPIASIGDPIAGLQRITAPLDIQGAATDLTISDAGDTIGRTATLLEPTGGSSGLLRGLAPADITFSSAGSRLHLETGSGDDTVDLKNTSSETILTNTGGNDQFAIGDGSVSSIPAGAQVLVLATAGHNAVTLNDATDVGGAGYYNLISQASPAHFPDLVAGKDVSELRFLTAPSATAQTPDPLSGIVFDNATTSSIAINALPSGENTFTVHSNAISTFVLPAQVIFNGNGDSTVQIDGNYNSTRFAVTANQLKVSSFGAAGTFSKGIAFTGVAALNSPALFAAGSVFSGATLSAGHLHAADSVLDYSNMSELDLGGNTLLSLDYSAGDALPQTLSLNGSFTISGLPVDHDPLTGHRILFQTRMYIQYTPSTEAATLALVKKYLTKAYTGGTWQPSGDDYISSQSANLDGKHSIGYADQNDHVVFQQPANTIEIRVSRIGDTDLDGHTTWADLARLQAHLGQSGDWDDGDLNYDGIVDATDLALLQKYLET